MQFVANGPDVPNSLLQAHEEGHVVFFCGAGISYPAGLKGFQWLVDEVYRLVGTTRNTIENDACKEEQFDVTLNLLEKDVGKSEVRKKLLEALEPNFSKKGATDTHSALLQLARNREGKLRLVTTNFDRIFEHLAKRTKQKITSFAAPMLPVPKKSRWDGLVYLHGLLPDKEDIVALDQLVLTSGDFGLAYLTERWAARFVSELFRNYVVCFVGYNLNDPVLRYTMDAFAADRRQGEPTPQAFAFGKYASGEREDKKIKEWEAKGVTPILYEVSSINDGHSLLHNTLKKWAETYRDGILGKESIVNEYALAHPSASTQQDDFVGRMLWALSDKSGLPAKHFADFDPVPSLAWLDFFSENRYQQSDLAHFGISKNAETDKKLSFSLLCRPAPYTLAPQMSMASMGETYSKWDTVMFHLARWLIRHLNDPALILWLTQQGDQLHEDLHWQINNKLNQLASLEQKGETAELDEIWNNAPNTIPRPLMKKLWSLLLAGRIKSRQNDLDILYWEDRLKCDGLTTTLRLELRELLAPKIVLREPFWRSDSSNLDEKPERLNQLVDWELVLAADYARSTLNELADNRWQKALPTLLDEFQQLLCDALDLLMELGEANNQRDPSHHDLPSISQHWQNRDSYDWVVLIELLRDAWLAKQKSDSKQATRIAQDWFEVPYPTFKRLALFAASQDDCIAPEQWVDWLINDDAWWLWSNNTQRETMRLLVLQGANLSTKERDKLEAVILEGPPREVYSEDIEPESWRAKVDRDVWLHLAKLKEGGSKLGKDALQRLTELSAANPKWKLADDERDEFPIWMGGSEDRDFEENHVIDIVPTKRKEIVKWLKQRLSNKPRSYKDNWRENCRMHLLNCLYALYDLAHGGCWLPVLVYWQGALQVWVEGGKLKRSWQFAMPLLEMVQAIPDDFLLKAAHSISTWLKSASVVIGRDEHFLLALCKRLMEVPYTSGADSDEPLTSAINHPIGHVTEALLNLWFKRKPNDNDTLPDDIKPFFTQLCDTSIKPFRHGRVLLASRLIALFRVDRQWTEQNLLPLFDWKKCPVEAKAVWEGFLWSPRLYTPLMIAFKLQFLETVNYYSKLGKHSNEFARFLTYAALNKIDGFAAEDFQKVFSKLPPEGLQHSAQALSQGLEGSGEQREDYWKNRITPFWQHIWPKSRKLISDNITKSLARMCIAANGEFRSAVTTVQGWLQPIKHAGHIVKSLCKSGLSKRFPEETLCFLDVIIDDQSLVPSEFTECLNTIKQTKPDLAEDHRFRRLKEHSRKQSY